MINKLVQVADDRWVSVTEYPDDTLALEGITQSEEYNAFQVTRIRFSRRAIEKLIPMMQEWLSEEKTVF